MWYGGEGLDQPPLVQLRLTEPEVKHQGIKTMKRQSHKLVKRCRYSHKMFGVFLAMQLAWLLGWQCDYHCGKWNVSLTNKWIFMNLVQISMIPRRWILMTWWFTEFSSSATSRSKFSLFLWIISTSSFVQMFMGLRRFILMSKWSKWNVLATIKWMAINWDNWNNFGNPLFFYIQPSSKPAKLITFLSCALCLALINQMIAC